MRWTICTHCHRGTLCSGIFQENLGLDPSPFHCHTAFSSAASFSRPCQRHTTTKKHSATGQKVCFLARKASIYNFIYVILIVSSLFASLRSHKTRVDPPATFAPLPRAIPLIRVSRCLVFYVCEGVCDSIMVLLFTSVAAGPSGPQIKCRDASPSSTAAEGSLLRGFVLGRRRKTGRACAERSKEPFHTAEPIMRFTRLNTNFIQGFRLNKKKWRKKGNASMVLHALNTQLGWIWAFLSLLRAGAMFVEVFVVRFAFCRAHFFIGHSEGMQFAR